MGWNHVRKSITASRCEESSDSTIAGDGVAAQAKCDEEISLYPFERIGGGIVSMIESLKISNCEFNSCLARFRDFGNTQATPQKHTFRMLAEAYMSRTKASSK